MTEFFARFGMLICSIIIAWLALRLHTKAKSSKPKGVAVKKSIAVILMVGAGMLAIGTIAGEWMGDFLGDAGPWVAGALLLLSAGPAFVDWVADGTPDKVALYCSFPLGIALVFGGVQVFDAIQGELEKQQTRIEMNMDAGQ